ncbi:Maf family protein [Celeribacter sp.]|uniref:Maf family protein n=1 Tax=Celeribacter sp. TaxID=1890673 RepID=UPI003A941BBB
MINTPKRIILASGSTIRRQLLQNAGVAIDIEVARIDEETIKDALVGEGAHPRDIADALAEGKARKISLRYPEAMVIGCDQVLSFKGRLVSKCATADEARNLLGQMQGERHRLLSATVIYEDGEPKWRHVGEVRMEMRPLTAAYLDDYIDRNWHSVRDAVGCYKLEEEGVRLFSSIEGEYFNVLGLPLLALLSHLVDRKMIAS